MRRILWLAGGHLSLALAVIGTALPIMPTVPFLLLAAFCFSRSSERLHQWLMTHPTFGGPLRDWNERGAISRNVKIIATVAMASGVGMAALIGLPTMALAAQATAMSAVALFIWSRPDA